MPTNNERRELARRLRDISDGVDEVSEIEIMEALDIESTSRNGYSAADVRRVAGFIEPEPERTCHDVTPWGDFFTCSECNGQVMLRPDVRWPDDGKILRTPTLIDGEGLGMRYPRFCSNCGAKVVDE